MLLSRQTLSAIKPITGLGIPSPDILLLPEKILQFGTGVLLRGLPGYFVDKANKQGIFNGRMVVVKSTSQGGIASFAAQDNLYTQCIRGIDNGRTVEEAVINASISRVLTAATQWPEVLACAANPELQIIISNTTEVGLVWQHNDDVHALPPASFPGKLLAFLLHRYTVFNGSATAGMVIIPTELVPDNGVLLKDIVIKLAKENHLAPAFIEWLSTANDFCSSLVDRIVPGTLPGEEKAATESRLGYKDNLMIMSEVYRLWAIETADARTIELLSFSQADNGVVIAPKIDRFRELKLRLLNGSHTFSCALAVAMGFSTVRQAMEHELFYHFISTLMLHEIVPAITGDAISAPDAQQFAAAVLDRYKNPFIEHQWLAIALQYSSKMKMRNVPLLQQYYQKKAAVPRYMAMGFAAYALFMKTEKHQGQPFTGRSGDREYVVHDDKAADLYQLWLTGNTDNFVQHLLQSEALWNTRLDTLPGFKTAVASNITAIQQHGAVQALQQVVDGNAEKHKGV